MKTLFLFLLFADSVLAKPAPKVVFSLTAMQGDGSTVTIVKTFGASIYFTLTCANPVTADHGEVITAAAGSAAAFKQWSCGDVSLLLIINPTANPLPAVQSFPSVPALGISGVVTTNIRSGGVITGQTPIVTLVNGW